MSPSVDTTWNGKTPSGLWAVVRMRSVLALLRRVGVNVAVIPAGSPSTRNGGRPL